MPRKSWIGLLLALSLPLVAFPSCLRDFNQFEATGEGAGATGDGDSGDGDGDGDGDMGGTSGDGDGDVGAGGEDTGACASGEKLCGEDCLPTDDPATGCDEPSCDACPAPPHATSTCVSGACGVGACENGFVDCDGELETGCEHSQSSFTELACGGCNADCTTLGLTDCQSGLCGCAQASECDSTNNRDQFVECELNARLCVCDSVSCNRGETCRNQGNNVFCACGTGDACPAGRTCCPGAGGPSCKQLDGSDSANCGACGWQCPAGQVCVNGSCE